MGEILSNLWNETFLVVFVSVIFIMLCKQVLRLLSYQFVNQILWCGCWKKPLSQYFFLLIVTNNLETKTLSSFFFNFVVWQPYVYSGTNLLPWTDVRHGSQLSLSFFLLLHPAPPPEQQSTFWIFFFPDNFLHAPVFLLIFLKQNPSPAPLASTII